MGWFKSTILKKDFWIGRKSWQFLPTQSFSVCVVIPAFNEEDFIADTIESVLSQSFKCRVIVVDDCSTDNTASIIKNYNVEYVKTDVNQGSKSQALNYAIEMIDEEIFICVDADTILEPNAIEKLLKAFNDENIYIASGFVKTKCSDNIWQSARHGEYILGQCISKSAHSNTNSIIVASGCFMAVRTSFIKSHGFKKRTMAEDMDMTWEVIENGFEVAFVDDAICHVSDPYNWHTYNKQLERWYRGFFQNIKVRSAKSFMKTPRLSLVIFPYFVLNISMLPLNITALIYMLYFSPFLVLGGFLVATCMMAIAFIYCSYKTKSNIFSLVKAFVCMLLTSVLSYGIYVKSAYCEFIMKDTLDNWVKGH